MPACILPQAYVYHVALAVAEIGLKDEPLIWGRSLYETLAWELGFAGSLSIGRHTPMHSGCLL